MVSTTGGHPQLYLLDTNILVAYIRAGTLGELVEAKYSLKTCPYRPLICVVTVGEVLAFAKRREWGKNKIDAMERLLNNLVRIDISAQEVLEAYAKLHAFSTSHGHQISDNDLWIAASVRATEATLLTTDKDFDPLAAAGLISRDWVDPSIASGRSS